MKTGKLSSLKLDPNNARKHSKKNLETIKASLEKFGQVKNIVVWNGTIMAGNGTVMAAQDLGWNEIAYEDISHMTEQDAKAYALADNRTAELAEWDDDVLGKQLQELYEDGYAIADFGFDSGDWDNEDSVGSMGEITGSKELSEDDFSKFDNQCPKCGFEFDNKSS